MVAISDQKTDPPPTSPSQECQLLGPCNNAAAVPEIEAQWREWFPGLIHPRDHFWDALQGRLGTTDAAATLAVVAMVTGRLTASITVNSNSVEDLMVALVPIGLELPPEYPAIGFNFTKEQVSALRWQAESEDDVTAMVGLAATEANEEAEWAGLATILVVT